MRLSTIISNFLRDSRLRAFNEHQIANTFRSRKRALQHRQRYSIPQTAFRGSVRRRRSPLPPHCATLDYSHRRMCTLKIWEDDRESDRKSTRLNSSHTVISYAVFCLKKKKKVS